MNSGRLGTEPGLSSMCVAMSNSRNIRLEQERGRAGLEVLTDEGWRPGRGEPGDERSPRNRNRDRPLLFRAGVRHGHRLPVKWTILRLGRGRRRLAADADRTGPGGVRRDLPSPAGRRGGGGRRRGNGSGGIRHSEEGAKFARWMGPILVALRFLGVQRPPKPCFKGFRKRRPSLTRVSLRSWPRPDSLLQRGPLGATGIGVGRLGRLP